MKREAIPSNFSYTTQKDFRRKENGNICCWFSLSVQLTVTFHVFSLIYTFLRRRLRSMEWKFTLLECKILRSWLVLVVARFLLECQISSSHACLLISKMQYLLLHLFFNISLVGYVGGLSMLVFYIDIQDQWNGSLLFHILHLLIDCGVGREE